MDVTLPPEAAPTAENTGGAGKSKRTRKPQRDRAAADSLASGFHRIVKYQVGLYLRKGLPPFVDAEELQSAALTGLYNAAIYFDQSRGVKFETYAGGFIYHAMHDRMRELDWVNRSTRKAMPNLTVQTNTTRWYSHKGNIHSNRTIEVDVLTAHGRPNRPAIDETDPLSINEARDVYTFLQENLPEDMALLIRQRFQEERSLKEIGKMTVNRRTKRIGVCESRVCQMVTEAIEAARDLLEHGTTYVRRPTAEEGIPDAGPAQAAD